MDNKRLNRLCAAVFLICFGTAAGAQEPHTQGVPNDIYYLMPAFGDGTVYLRGQSPAQGKLNICALDNSLRFLDKDGKELTAGDDVDIVKVRIDSVVFVRVQDAFYRLYPLSDKLGVAVRREVRVLHDAKEGAYGTVSQTTSVHEFRSIVADGVLHELNPDKIHPHTVSNLIFVFQDGDILPYTRKNLRKLFPGKKDDIDAYFKAGHSQPKTGEEALSLLARWAGYPAESRCL